MCVAACGLAMFAGTARAQAVSQSKVIDLMAQAQAQLQGQAATPAVPQQGGALAPTGKAVDLTMDEAVAKALQLNIDLSVERLNPQLQDLSLAASRGAYVPTVNGTFTTQQRDDRPGQHLPGRRQGHQPDAQLELRRHAGGQADRRHAHADLEQLVPRLDEQRRTRSTRSTTRRCGRVRATPVAESPDRQQPPDAADGGDQPADLGHLPAGGDGQHHRQHAERLLGLRLHHPGGGGGQDVAGPGRRSWSRTTR